jgi:hypothetical protein
MDTFLLRFDCCKLGLHWTEEAEFVISTKDHQTHMRMVSDFFLERVFSPFFINRENNQVLQGSWCSGEEPNANQETPTLLECHISFIT